MTIPVALTIAGSDSGGGAGIQADLRTFSFHLVHGTSAITCVTAQNTLGVNRVDALPPEAVVAQIQAISSDIGFRAVKTGMLLNAEIIEAVVAALDDFPTRNLPIQNSPIQNSPIQNSPIQNLVVDPVMVSRTGAQLIDDAAIATLTQQLLPKALIATPNRYEAQMLADLEIHTLNDMKVAASVIHRLGPKFILVKGGGMTGALKGVDVWFDGSTYEVIATQVIETPHTHGTGCTLSAAIAANLALGKTPLEAVRAAKMYVTEALQHSLSIGQGQGPVGHWFPLLPADLSVPKLVV
jgi:hydroxymethylpyrimidine/phosphomethylpyrimidine kinase